MDTKEMPLVSVVVPVYNAEEYIARCVESILTQTYDKLELILVDDGSPDGSGGICDEYALKDKRIRVIHTINCGVSHARNTGLDNATGKYIVFVDSDDWVEPEHLELLLPVNNESLVYCGMNFVTNGIITSKHHFDTNSCVKKDCVESFGEFWKKYTMWSVCRGCFRNAIIKENNLHFDVSMKIGEDEHFNIRYMQYCSSVRFSKVCTYNYDVGDHPSALHRFNSERFADCIKICQAIEAISHKPEYERRWYYWKSVIRHYDKWQECSTKENRKEVSMQMKRCYQEPYFRESIPFMRKNGTLDEKVETFFMHRFLHPLYPGFYKLLVAISRIKRHR